MDMDRFWVFMGILVIIYGVCTYLEKPFTTRQMLENYTPESVSKFCKLSAAFIVIFGAAFIVDSYSAGNRVLEILRYVLYAVGGIPIVYLSFKVLKKKEKKSTSLRDVTKRK